MIGFVVAIVVLVAFAIYSGRPYGTYMIDPVVVVVEESSVEEAV